MDQQPQTNNPYPEPSGQHKPNNAWKETASTVAIILLAPLVAIFLTQFVFQSYMVDGPSMQETLHDGDRLIVTKTGKTWSRITRSDFIPERYDIVIFNHSGEFGASEGNVKQLVKRVIGLPGDRVVVKDGVITIFNKEHPDGFLVDREGPEKNTIGNTSGNIDETVGDGEIYVCGDNRENSLDSRSFGTVRSQDLVGTLALRIYPFDKVEKF